MNTEFFSSTPFGSLITQPDNVDSRLSEIYFDTPKNTKIMLSSLRTGSYIRGLTKLHGLQPEQAPNIAFAVLRVAVGEIEQAKLASVLSSELKIANDKAQAIALEIEKDLFAPVALELSQYLAKKKQQERIAKAGLPPGASASGGAAGGAKNVLNLKETKKPPKPPEIPR